MINAPPRKCGIPGIRGSPTPPRKCGIPGIRGSETPPRKYGIPGIRGSQTLHPKYTPKEVWNSRNSWKSDAPPQIHPQGSVEFQEFVEVRRSTPNAPPRKCGIPGIRGNVKHSRTTCICVTLEYCWNYYGEHCIPETTAKKLQYHISKSLCAA